MNILIFQNQKLYQKETFETYKTWRTDISTSKVARKIKERP